MTCSCQTTSLKVVIRSLTQLSVTETRVHPQRFSILTRLSPRPRLISPLTVAFIHGTYRGFRSSPGLGNYYNRDDEYATYDQDGMLDTDFEEAEPQEAPPIFSEAESDSYFEKAYRKRDMRNQPVPAPVAVSPEELITRLKKALRRAKRTEQIAVPFDPTDSKKEKMIEAGAMREALQAKQAKEEGKSMIRRQAGEEEETWRKHKLAMKRKFPEGWNPRKKLSPDAIEGIQILNKQFPDQYSTPVLSNKFGISPEAVRRILKSTWRQKGENTEELAARWTERGMRVWTQLAAFGVNPPTKWEKLGIKRDMLQIGQRDSQEGNRTGRYWEKKALKMKEEYSARFRRQQSQGASRAGMPLERTVLRKPARHSIRDRTGDIESSQLERAPHPMEDDIDEGPGRIPGRFSNIL